MKPAIGYHWVSPLSSWQQIPKGDLLRACEQKAIADRLQYCFGKHFLKIGKLTNELDTSMCLINHQVHLDSDVNDMQRSGLIGEYDELPLQSESIDAVLMCHILEYCSDPHQVLREVHRIMLANGNLVVAVFNPLSMLSFKRFLPISSYKPFNQGRFFSVARVKDWLNLLGFEVTHEQFVYHSNLEGANSVLDNNRLSKLSKTILPRFGGVAIIQAKKREWPLTPVRPRLRYKSVFGATVGASHMNKT